MRRIQNPACLPLSITFLALCCVAPAKSTYVLEATETFGNKPVLATNYSTWPRDLMSFVNHDDRVYWVDVNGHENFYYDSDVDALNAVLIRFAKLDLKKREVILLPGTGHGHSILREREYAFTWEMKIVGGIVKAVMDREEKSELVWPTQPRLTIHVDGEKIKLNEIRFPEGLEIHSIADVRASYEQAIKSGSETTAGSAIHQLGELDPLDQASMEIVIAQLAGENEWAAINASSAIGNFGALANEKLDQLQKIAAEHKSDRVKDSLAKSIEKIKQAEVPDDKFVKSHQEMVDQLNRFAKMPSFAE
jgi:hypothetical protein